MLQKILFSLLALALIACGSRPTGPSGNIDQDTAASLVGESGGAMKLLASGNPYSSTGVSSMFASGSRAMDFLKDFRIDTRGCTPTAGGDTTDADSDGIKKGATYTFTGCSDSLTITGDFKMTDDDDTKAFPSAGMGLTFGFTMSTTLVGQTIDVKVAGDFDINMGTTSSTARIDLLLTGAATNYSAIVGYFLDATATPTDSASPAAGGALSLAGFFKMDTTLSGSNKAFVLKLTTADLTYGTCSRVTNHIKSGEVTFLDGSSNRLVGTYTDCDATWTYNGTSL